MKVLIGTLVLAFAALAVSAEKARFDNYRVYSIDVDTHDQLTVLREISETSDSVRRAIIQQKYDFLTNYLKNSTLSGMNRKASTLKLKSLFHPTSLHILVKS